MRQIRHRTKLPPDLLIKRISTLLESAEIVEGCIGDLIAEVQMPDIALEKIQFSQSLTRRQIGCLKRAIEAAETLLSDQ